MLSSSPRTVRTPIRIATSPRLTRLNLMGLLALWRSRRALARLTTDQLRDVGISKTDARTEADKPLWDVPDHWLK